MAGAATIPPARLPLSLTGLLFPPSFLSTQERRAGKLVTPQGVRVDDGVLPLTYGQRRVLPDGSHAAPNAEYKSDTVIRQDYSLTTESPAACQTTSIDSAHALALFVPAPTAGERAGRKDYRRLLPTLGLQLFQLFDCHGGFALLLFECLRRSSDCLQSCSAS
jgi:hypothetical protein